MALSSSHLSYPLCSGMRYAVSVLGRMASLQESRAAPGRW
jgi:hypothetical protein